MHPKFFQNLKTLLSPPEIIIFARNHPQPLLNKIIDIALKYQPNRPVTYSIVFSTFGFVKILEVSPYSMSRPKYINAVLSETRAACCML